jgi:anti-sigma B factor antagonist
MILKFTEQSGVTIAEFVDHSRFTLAICDEVKAEVRELLNRGVKKLIFDLHDITFIDSSGVGCIIALFKTARSVGSTLRLCNLTPEVLEIFELLHLQVIFDITGTRESCLKEI